MSHKLINISVILILGGLFLAVIANSMTKPLGHDEQMYCTGGVLLAQGKMIYRDFSYVSQMPYHPLLYAVVFKILKTTYYLLVARILSSICDILVIICIYGIYRHVFNSFSTAGSLLGLAASILYIFNPFVDYANGFAWNHDLVILCVATSFWLFLSIDFNQKSKCWRIAAIGAILTLATCMRITTAIIQLMFFAVLLIQPAGSVKQRFKTILPFLIATAIVMIWPIWTAALAPRAFFLNLFRIPMLNSQLLHQISMTYNKIDLILLFFTTPACVSLIIIGVYLCIILVLTRHKLTTFNPANISVATLLPIISFIVAILPPTMWIQYLAIPVPFLLISFALPLFYLRKPVSGNKPNKHFAITSALIVASVILVVASYPVVLLRIPDMFKLQNWTPLRLHKISEDIAEKTNSPKRILTLAPLYALEGGCEIYTQFSAGPFAYRVADALSSADRQVTNTVGLETIRRLYEQFPPSAVIVNAEPMYLEEPLKKAVTETWERKVYGDNGPIVYFKR